MEYIGIAMLVTPFVVLLYLAIEEHGFMGVVVPILIAAMIAALLLAGAFILTHYSS